MVENALNPNKVAFTRIQNDAIKFILVWHSSQRRVGTVLPYVVHPIEVASLVGRFYPDKQDLIIAAYLHDVLEDTECQESHIEETFGKTITELVKGVTAKDDDFGSWRERRQHQIDKLKTAPIDVVRLKACDMLSNALAIGFDLRFRPEEGYPKFRKNPDDVKWYYRAAEEVFYYRLPSDKVVTALNVALAVWGA